MCSSPPVPTNQGYPQFLRRLLCRDKGTNDRNGTGARGLALCPELFSEAFALSLEIGGVTGDVRQPSRVGRR